MGSSQLFLRSQIELLIQRMDLTGALLLLRLMDLRTMLRYHALPFYFSFMIVVLVAIKHSKMTFAPQ